jgi:hypothetical protein
MHPATAGDGWSVDNPPALVHVELAHNTTVSHATSLQDQVSSPLQDHEH